MASALAGQSGTSYTAYQQVATGGDGTVYMTTGAGGLIPAQPQAYDTGAASMTLLAVPTSSGTIRYTTQPAAAAAGAVSLLPAPMPPQTVMLQPSGSGSRDTTMLTSTPAGVWAVHKICTVCKICIDQLLVWLLGPGPRLLSTAALPSSPACPGVQVA
jgi:hypothetical protein